MVWNCLKLRVVKEKWLGNLYVAKWQAGESGKEADEMLPSAGPAAWEEARGRRP